MVITLLGLAGVVALLVATLGRRDRDGAPVEGSAADDAAAGAAVTAPDTVLPVDAAPHASADGPAAAQPSRPWSTVDARRARSRPVDASPVPAVVAPDARSVAPRPTADAAPRSIEDAAPRRRADAPAWGTTVNPFEEHP
jgi:hypothetical protein